MSRIVAAMRAGASARRAGRCLPVSDDTLADEVGIDEEIRRLSWQCRRGMLELDHLLMRFLSIGYRDLDAASRATFVRLLDSQDQDLSDWFMSRAIASDAELGDMVRRIIKVAGTKHP